MKKIFSLLTAVLLVLALMAPVQGFAQEDKGLERAISTAKSLLNITGTYDDFNYSINNQEGKTIYYLSWNDSKNKLGNVSASIDSDGKISSYYYYKPYDGRSSISKIPTVSKADALEKANDFIKKVNPSIWSSIQYKESNAPMSVHDMNYEFYYVRVENGIPFTQNNVRVSVDCREGFIQSYSLNWIDGLTFPAASGVMPLERAKEAFTEKLGLKLVYKLSYDRDNQTPYLMYTNVYSGRSIDAVTGEVVYNNGIYYDGPMEKAAAMGATRDSAAKQENIVLTPEEKGAVENASSFLTQAKAEETGRRVLNLDSSYKLETINLYSMGMGKGNYAWNMYFNKEEKKDGSTIYQNASISIDAVTGEVLNFYRYVPYDANTPVKYDKNQSQKIAEDFIKSMQSAKLGEVEYTSWGEPEYRPLDETEKPRQYYFNFVRKAGNAYFLDNGFNISVDTTSGMVTNYSYTWYKGQLPPADKAITSARAHEILFDSVGIELQYIADYTNSRDAKVIMPPIERGLTPQIKLVYTHKPGKPSNIDANSGNLLDYAGKPYEEMVIAQYTDINGNAAENQIKILAQYGISLPGNTFKPNQAITQREFLYLLVKAMDPYVGFRPSGDSKDDEDLYNYLMNMGIVKEGEKSPASSVAKQDGVKFIIRALKYDKVGDIKGIYTLPFKDAKSIKSDLYGYVAIAYGLNIVKDTKGYFNPNSSLTRGDSAVVLYNLLNIN